MPSFYKSHSLKGPFLQELARRLPPGGTTWPPNGLSAAAPHHARCDQGLRCASPSWLPGPFRIKLSVSYATTVQSLACGHLVLDQS
jgi:hypothetical protein